MSEEAGLMMQRLTYKKAGVDIASASLFKKRLQGLVKSSCAKEVLKGIGGFGGLFAFPKNEYRQPVLVSSADGVGTKLKIAQLVNKHDTVGIDLVAMNANDILCTGAAPLFFLDYIAYSNLEAGMLLDIVRGINAGCVESGCALIGGETAQMPGMYKKGEYDLAGFCVGAVERKEIIDGSGIEPGNIVVGLESGGLHSNGYSLVRKVFSKKTLARMSQELLRPTRIYVKPVLSLLRADYREGQKAVKGIAHITGGAFYDKISRILPEGVAVNIHKDSWKPPQIFRLIQNKGDISTEEMYHTFNMGIGMVLVVEPSGAGKIRSLLAKFKLRSWIIGEAVRGRRQVKVI